VKKSSVSEPGAPALEKGLDLLEALAEHSEGLSQKALACRVGRSVGEIFRMLGVLERRGFVARDASGQYVLTLRLFELAHRHPPERRLLHAAIGVMEQLSTSIGHACHLASMHGDRIIVMAQALPDFILMGWSVRLGAVLPFSQRFVSARIIAAFQRPERQCEMIRVMLAQDDCASEDALRGRLAAIQKAGYDLAPSELAAGVTDMSSPILNQFGQAVAALTTPVMVEPGADVDERGIVSAVRSAAQTISMEIGGIASGDPG